MDRGFSDDDKLRHSLCLFVLDSVVGSSGTYHSAFHLRDLFSGTVCLLRGRDHGWWSDNHYKAGLDLLYGQRAQARPET